jgi:hypothetical protein
LKKIHTCKDKKKTYRFREINKIMYRSIQKTLNFSKVLSDFAFDSAPSKLEMFFCRLTYADVPDVFQK